MKMSSVRWFWIAVWLAGALACGGDGGSGQVVVEEEDSGIEDTLPDPEPSPEDVEVPEPDPLPEDVPVEEDADGGPEDVVEDVDEVDAESDIPVSECGDGLREQDEDCDGDDLDGLSCVDFEQPFGRLGCTPQCVFELSGCGLTPICGDGLQEGDEACDEGEENDDEAPNACRTDCEVASCGDGVVDEGELCDEGRLNSDFDADACRSDCTPARCGDGVIDDGEACDEGEGNSDEVPDACRVECVEASCGDGVEDEGEACDDGNGIDGDGCTGCVPDECGSDDDCDDNNPCTGDVCDAGACRLTPVEDGEVCDDGLSCTESDACEEGRCVGLPVVCDELDGVCVEGVCEEGEGGCFARPIQNGTGCEDGLTCTVDTVCQDGACVGDALDCAELDGDCQIGACEEGVGCVREDRPEGTLCDDGRFCTAVDRCAAGVCEGQVPREIDDGVDCTEDLCDEESETILHTPRDAACDNGLLCDGAESCDRVLGCRLGEPVDCSELGGVCEVGQCSEEAEGCETVPVEDGDGCDDGDRCTEGDRCQGGECVGDDADCTDLDGACQVGVCDPNEGCVAVDVMNGTGCEDGDLCTVGDSCQSGVCEGSPRDCSGSGGACRVGACDPETGECVSEPLDVGDPCNDGIACTESDTCDESGRCLGTLNLDCLGDLGCESSSPLPQTLDIPVAIVTTEVTLDGAELPNSNPDNDSAIFYLRSNDTGALHEITRFRYVPNGPFFDNSHSLLPGVYDLLYRRDYGETSQIVDRNTTTDLLPNGFRVLQSQVLLGAGPNNLEIDIPVATLDMNVTLGGAALPNSNPDNDSAIFYLKAQDTGALHEITRFRYVPNGPFFDNSHSLLPGRYDLIYRRDYGETSRIVDRNTTTDLLPNGFRVLQTDVDIVAGENRLDIDIPVASVQTNVTLAGGDLPNSNPDNDSAIFYLRSNDTGALHEITRFRYVPNGPFFDRSHSLLPGIYDLIYRRDYGETSRIVDRNTTTDLLPNGFRVLQLGVSLSEGENILDIDIPVASVTTEVTLAGGDLPNSNPDNDSAIFYLRSNDTGALHEITRFRYVPNGPFFDRSHSLLPGVYDLIYRRDYGETSRIVDRNTTTDLLPNGFRVLQAGVSLAAGANNLAIDIPRATLALDTTLQGGDLPNSNPDNDSAIFYLRSNDTGALHEVQRFRYVPNGPFFDLSHSLLPGVYDLLYRRDYGETSRIVDRNITTDLLPNGFRVLQAGVDVGSGVNEMTFDIPVATLNPDFTLDGGPLPNRNPDNDSAIFYLQSRDTGALHEITRFRYVPNGPFFDRSHSLLPGIYDLIYRRDYGETSRIVDRNTTTDLLPNGFRVLQGCVEVR